MSDGTTTVEAPVTPEPVEAPIKEAPKPSEPAKASKERMWNVKTNGKEEQWPESKVLERAQKAEGAEAAMKEAAQLRVALQNFVARVQDPKELIGLLENPSLKFGEDKQELLITQMLSSKNPRVVQAVKKWLWENEVEPSQLTPEQRELRELKSFKEKSEQDKQAREKMDLDAKEQADIERAWNHYRTKIGEEIRGAGLPERETNVARVARYAMLQKKQGVPVDLKDCVARVKQDLIEEYKQLHSSVDEGSILNYLDEETVKKINAAWTKKIQSVQSEKELSKGDAPTYKRKERKPDLSPKERRQWLRDLERGNIA